MLRESWKAADPAVAAGRRALEGRASDNPLLWVWFVVYGVGTIVLADRRGDAAVPARSAATPTTSPTAYADAQGVMIAASIVGIVSAVAVGARRAPVDRSPHRLTGEARG